MVNLADIVAGGHVDAGDVARVRNHLLMDRGNVRDKYSRFILMLALSAIIATGGIVEDSTAVVVGAMIIAPLMTPMLATALSTITGDGRNALRSLLITLTGAAFVVALAVLVTLLAPGGLQLAGNAQVAARTAPRVLDLVVALAAGVAGALAVVRKDVPEVLPGVAVSISVVPPLCVAGTALAMGSWQLGYGALVLFATNFFAIQLAGGAVFAAVGFSKVALESASPHARSVGIVVAALGATLCLLPLGATSAQLANAAALQRQASAAVGQWLEGSDFEALSVTAQGTIVTVEITGTGFPPGRRRLPTCWHCRRPYRLRCACSSCRKSCPAPNRWPRKSSPLRRRP